MEASVEVVMGPRSVLGGRGGGEPTLEGVVLSPTSVTCRAAVNSFVPDVPPYVASLSRSVTIRSNARSTVPWSEGPGRARFRRAAAGARRGWGPVQSASLGEVTPTASPTNQPATG